MERPYHTTTTTRRGPAKASKLGSKPLRFDSHGDVDLDFVEDCGATVIPGDRYSRLLALSPIARRL